MPKILINKRKIDEDLIKYISLIKSFIILVSDIYI